MSEYHAICPGRGVNAGRLDCRTRDLVARARCNFPNLVNLFARVRYVVCHFLVVAFATDVVVKVLNVTNYTRNLAT